MPTLFLPFLFLLVVASINVPALADGLNQIEVGIPQGRSVDTSSGPDKRSLLSIEVINDIAIVENWRVTFVYDLWPNLLAKLEAGEIDILSGISYSEARAQRFDFTSEELVTNWGVVYQRPDVAISSPLDLEGKRVAVVNNEIHGLTFLDLLEKFSVTYTLITTTSYGDALLLLENGEVDAAVINRFFGIFDAHEYNVVSTAIVFNPVQVRFATPKGKGADLRAAIDRYLSAGKSDPGSSYHENLNRWLDTQVRMDIPLWLVWSSGGVLAGLCLTLIVVWLLRRRVSFQTGALRESEERYRSLVEDQSQLICRFHPDTTLTYANDAYERFFDKTPKELIGIRFADFLTDEVKKETLHFLASFTPEHPIQTNEQKIIGADGFFHWHIWDNRAFFDDFGNVVSFQGVGTDITERKRAEEQFRRFFELPLVGSAIYQPNKKWIAVNDTLCELLGYSREDMKMITWPDVTHPDDLEENLKLFNGALSGTGGEAYSMDKRFIRKDGSVIHTLICAQCVRKPNGAPDFFILLVQDITERKLADRALRESEEKYRTYIENAPEGIFVADQNGNYVDVNKGACELLGYSRDKLLSMKITDIIPPKLMPKVLNDFEKLKQTGSLHVEQLFRKNGGLDLDVSLKAILLPNGYLMVFCTDITERKRIEKALQKAKAEAEKANKSKTEFLANMSHDLRTPLSAIMGFAEMMESKVFGPLGDPHYEEYAKDIHNSGDLLVSLIDDILDISKVESGKYELNDKTLDVPSLIQSSVKMISTLAEMGKLHLATNIEPNLPMLRGDEKAITQILNNVLSNAVKFTPPDGKITISAKMDGNVSINVLVADTGEGMSRRDINKALSPFEQADSAHSKRHEGTGLGLHLCQKLIMLHDGDIKLQSKVGKGTTVTVRFPPERTVVS